MQISLDFGGSTVDAVLWDGDLIKSINTYESKDVPVADAEFRISKTAYNKRPSGVLEKFFEFSGISLKGVKRIFVTGGKSRFFPDEVCGIKVQRVSEIEAIGEGIECRISNTEYREDEEKRGRNSQFRIPYSNRLVVSMGTGTCMVSVKGGKIKHVGGTGVGGGTFVGLGRELLGVSDINELLEIAKKGLSKNVDISVSEIVGGSIGRVSGEATASNFGKLRDEIKFKEEDLAAGIVNLIGQTIGISAVFAAKAEDVEVVVLTGKLTRACAVTDIVKGIIEGYGLKVSVPENAEYAVAIGAKVAGERLIG